MIGRPLALPDALLRPGTEGQEQAEGKEAKMKAPANSCTHSEIQANQTRPAKGAIAVIRNSALALTLGAALALSGFGFATPADAAPNSTQEGHESLCKNLETLWKGNIEIANDPKQSKAARAEARATAARIKADFDKNCKFSVAESAGAPATSVDLVGLPQEMAPATTDESSASLISLETFSPRGSRLGVR